MAFRPRLSIGAYFALQLVSLPAFAQERLTPEESGRPLVGEETGAEKADAAKVDVNL